MWEAGFPFGVPGNSTISISGASLDVRGFEFEEAGISVRVSGNSTISISGALLEVRGPELASFS